MGLIYKSFIAKLKIQERKKYFDYLEKAREKIHFSDGLPIEYRDGQAELYLQKKQERYYPDSVHGWSLEDPNIGLDNFRHGWKGHGFCLIIASGFISLGLPSCRESWMIWTASTIAFFLFFASFDMMARFIMKFHHIKIAAECQALRDAIAEKRRSLQEISEKRVREHMEKSLREAFPSF